MSVSQTKQAAVIFVYLVLIATCCVIVPLVYPSIHNGLVLTAGGVLWTVALIIAGLDLHRIGR